MEQSRENSQIFTKPVKVRQTQSRFQSRAAGFHKAISLLNHILTAHQLESSLYVAISGAEWR